MKVHRPRYEGAVTTNRNTKDFVPLMCDTTFKFFKLYLGTAVLKHSTGIHVKMYATEINPVTPVFI